MLKCTYYVKSNKNPLWFYTTDTELKSIEVVYANMVLVLHIMPDTVDIVTKREPIFYDFGDFISVHNFKWHNS